MKPIHIFLVFLLVLIVVALLGYHSYTSDMYLTHKTYRDLADYDYDTNKDRLIHDIHTNSIPPGSIIVTYTENSQKLLKDIQGIRENVTLLFVLKDVDGSDKSVKYSNLLENPYISQVFSENWYDRSHPKVHQIPIGVSYKDIYMKGIQSDLEDISENMSPNKDKPLRVFCNAHKRTYPTPASGYRDDRQVMINMLRDSSIIDFCDDRHDFTAGSLRKTWEKHQDYAFELSPSGNGLDCHRTYEAIILKTIPIVRKNTLVPIYTEHDLPVVVVDEWSDVTQENLLFWHEKYNGHFTDSTLNKMKSEYWRDYITDKIRGV